MKANELRIGNWHFIPGIDRYVQVCAIYKTHFKCQDSNGVVFDESIRINYQPIPLTPEVLEKCGNIYNLNSIQTKGGEMFVDLDSKQLGVCGEDSITSGMTYYADCQYLHQLQNLYFALTGEELTYTP